MSRSHDPFAPPPVEPPHPPPVDTGNPDVPPPATEPAPEPVPTEPERPPAGRKTRPGRSTRKTKPVELEEALARLDEEA